MLGQCWKKCFPLFCSYQGTYVAVGISEDDKMGEDLVKRHLQIAKYGSVVIMQISKSFRSLPARTATPCPPAGTGAPPRPTSWARWGGRRPRRSGSSRTTGRSHASELRRRLLSARAQHHSWRTCLFLFCWILGCVVKNCKIEIKVFDFFMRRRICEPFF